MKQEICYLCGIDVFFNAQHNRYYHNDGTKIYPWCAVAAPKKKKQKKNKKKNKHA